KSTRHPNPSAATSLRQGQESPRPPRRREPRPRHGNPPATAFPAGVPSSNGAAQTSLRPPAAAAPSGSALVRFKPPRPATRNFRPTDGLASNSVTPAPPAAATSAVRKPAGPPPM